MIVAWGCPNLILETWKCFIRLDSEVSYTKRRSPDQNVPSTKSTQKRNCFEIHQRHGFSIAILVIFLAVCFVSDKLSNLHLTVTAKASLKNFRICRSLINRKSLKFNFKFGNLKKPIFTLCSINNNITEAIGAAYFLDIYLPRHKY